jgi:pimeloyl-ACP methyl ester carboxylesterase
MVVATIDLPVKVREVQGVNRPIWLEALFLLDWFALRTSPTYYGIGVPRGHGEPVVLVPGFLGTDDYLREMYLWLWRIGYRPYYSGVGRNADCPELLTQRLLITVGQAHQETGQSVSVIGHSLGGILARGAAIRQPAIISRVIMLGSPFREVKAHPFVAIVADEVGRQVRRDGKSSSLDRNCFTPDCSCPAISSLQNCTLPASVDRLAIYSPLDGITDPASCREVDERYNRRVYCTHFGLAFNPQVYIHLARSLHESKVSTRLVA